MASPTFAAMFKREQSSCIDGRAHGLIYGSPGGDAGILIRVIEARTIVGGGDPRYPKGDMSIEEIKGFIYKLSQKIGRKLYFHTDAAALAKYNPTAGFDKAKAIEAASIGCGYLQAACCAPERLDSDPRRLKLIAAKVVVAFAELAAEGGPVTCAVLEGQHAEDSVLVIKNAKKADCAGHRFVYHPNHEEAVAALMFETLGDSGEALLIKFKQVAAAHWAGVSKILASGLPVTVDA